MLQNSFFALLLLLSLGARAFAQEPRSYLHGFTGPVVVPQSAFTRWNGTVLPLGGGGEALIANKFGLEGEAGVLLPTSAQYAVTTGLLSFDPAYHFLETNSSPKLDPFVNLDFRFGIAFRFH
jgi:hypothetical protein